MMVVQQAIFTSVAEQQREGYQLARASRGITSEMARELSIWGPAHDSLISDVHEATSVNFHPLGSEHFVLSLTTRNGSEYSGRGGGRIYSQILVLPREGMMRFDNHPLLVLEAVAASGRWMVDPHLPDTLLSFRLVGGAAGTSADRIAKCRALWGEEPMEQLATLLRGRAQVVLVADDDVEGLLSGALELLTPAERLQVSFSTGLRISQRRPFHLHVVPSCEQQIIRQLRRTADVCVIDLADLASLN